MSEHKQTIEQTAVVLDDPLSPEGQRQLYDRSPVESSGLDDEQRNCLDIAIRDLATAHSLDRTAAGGWIFENHNLFKFVYAVRASLPQPVAQPVKQTRALTDQQIYDEFGFLEGLVSERTYRKIADKAIEIARAASPQPALPNIIAHAPACGDGEDCHACERLDSTLYGAAAQPVEQTRALTDSDLAKIWAQADDTSDERGAIAYARSVLAASKADDAVRFEKAMELGLLRTEDIMEIERALDAAARPASGETE